ncbi:hypothetical protein [Antrihabitans spumae]|uniref:Uncharacterized protein n=1 Tax=Antrihabitans spumae TaxID=3373370 RepID=A0ABW7K309_9NOCA
MNRLSVGDYVQYTDGLSRRLGEPLKPRSTAGVINATRTFFRDLQEWEWIPRRFDPIRALAVPSTVAAVIGPNPRSCW